MHCKVNLAAIQVKIQFHGNLRIRLLMTSYKDNNVGNTLLCSMHSMISVVSVIKLPIHRRCPAIHINLATDHTLKTPSQTQCCAQWQCTMLTLSERLMTFIILNMLFTEEP